MKKIYKSILTLLLFIVGTTASWAVETFSNQAATFSWAVGNESDATLSEGIADAVSTTKVSAGSDLNILKTNATYTLGTVTAGPYCLYQPLTGNPGCVSTDMVEYTVQVKKGLTFTPTSFVFDAVKEGTDNAYFTWSYTIDGVESEKFAYSTPASQIRRNNNANPDAPLTHNEAVSVKGGQKVTLRFYISNVASNKSMAIGNVKINGTINGEVAQRKFKDFAVDFRPNPYSGKLPEGVAITAGQWHDKQHGYQDVVMTVPVDGPVKFTIGGCGYSNQATVKDASGNVLATLDTRGAGCDSETSSTHFINWTYNSETSTTLTLELGKYCPFISAQACELIPMRTVTYYDVDGKTIIGTEEVEGGSALAYKYDATNVSVAAGSKFRGWFNSTQASAIKVKEGTSVQENTTLYAKATPIEDPKVGDIFSYTLYSPAFYIEDHEAISSTGVFHDTQHGYVLYAGENISVKTAGNAIVNLGICKYSKEDATLTVTDANGNQVGEVFSSYNATDGYSVSIRYTGEPTTLAITASNESYIHNVTVYNVAEIPTKNEAGYYELASGDAASLQLVIASLQDGDKVYLPNGTYDFGEKCLTNISASNVSIIGESQKGVIIRNTPLEEGIGVTATFLLTGKNIYIQDLSLECSSEKCATPAASRCVTIQDKGSNNICKNVSLLSGQDTYYSNGGSAQKAYFEDCRIEGTVDFICGGGDVMFKNTTFYVRSRSTANVICAPNTDANTKWGYVMLDCSIDAASNQKDKYNFCRPWNGSPACTWINTKMLVNGSSAGYTSMSAGKVLRFHEYNTTNSNGTVVTSHKLDACSGASSSDALYINESAAANYTISNIYGTWAPDEIAKQVTEMTDEGIYLVDGKITNVKPTSGKVRIANGRGGFGPEVEVSATAISTINADVQSANSALYNISGQRIAANYRGIVIQNGKKTIK